MKSFLLGVLLLLIVGCSEETPKQLAPIPSGVSDTSNYTECSLFDDGACVNDDEVVTLFNSYAYFDESTQKWDAQIKGWIYEPDYLAAERSAFMLLIESVVGTIDKEPSFFEERIDPFLADNESDEAIFIEIGTKSYEIKNSNSVGHFFDNISIDDEDVKALAVDNILSYKIVMPKADSRVFEGKIYLLDDNGTMLISDVDDTLKITEVYLGNEKIIEHTFLQEFEVTPKMQELYKKLQSENENLSFHYVSGSPWELYGNIKKFLAKNGFEEGTLHLKELSINPFSSGLYDFLDKDSTYNHKVETISLMIQNFPHKRFILVGDSGEKDPEVYGYLLENYKAQIKSVYIRNVTGETLDNERMKAAFGKNVGNIVLINTTL